MTMEIISDAGEKWETTELTTLGPVYREQFSELCSKSKIILGLMGG